MKNLLLPFALVITMAACNQKSDKTDRDLLYINETEGTVSGDTARTTDPVVTTPNAPVNQSPAPAPRPVTQTPRPQPAPVATTPAPTPEPEPTVEAPAPSTDGSTADAPAEDDKKKGMSSSAKGAIIGGVAGAAAGAVIGKDAKGAVIGGAVGAAGGYIIGRNKDKKSGRIGGKDTTNN